MGIRRIHSIDGCIKPIGPYSLAVQAGNLFFLSGIIPLNDSGEPLVSDSFSEQVETVFNHTRKILSGLNLSLNSVIKVTAYLTDLDNFATFNEIYSKHFGDEYPARTTVQVARLPKNVKIELDLICFKE